MGACRVVGMESEDGSEGSPLAPPAEPRISPRVAYFGAPFRARSRAPSRARSRAPFETRGGTPISGVTAPRAVSVTFASNRAKGSLVEGSSTPDILAGDD